MVVHAHVVVNDIIGWAWVSGYTLAYSPTSLERLEDCSSVMWEEVCCFDSELHNVMLLTLLCSAIPYCPGQAPMGAHSSNIKNWRWVIVLRRYVLEWFNYPCASTHRRWRGTESTCIVALPVLCRGQPGGGESCIVLETLFPQCSSLAVCKFHAATFSGFSVGFCINEEKVTCYQL